MVWESIRGWVVVVSGDGVPVLTPRSPSAGDLGHPAGVASVEMTEMSVV